MGGAPLGGRELIACVQLVTCGGHVMRPRLVLIGSGKRFRFVWRCAGGGVRGGEGEREMSGGKGGGVSGEEVE